MIGLDVVFRACVQPHGFDSAAGIADQLFGFLHALAAIDRNQFCAFLCEQQRGGAADAAAGAGDDDGFAFEAAHAFLPVARFFGACRHAEFKDVPTIEVT